MSKDKQLKRHLIAIFANMIQIGTFENWNHLKTCHFEICILNVLGRVKAIYSDSLTLLNQVLASLAVLYKYAHILLFQFVFTKYVFCFRNYDRLIFVVFDVIFLNVIMRKYDKIRFKRYFHLRNCIYMQNTLYL